MSNVHIPTSSVPMYSIACPACGAQLQPVALDPGTAPWLCPISQRGYWASELTAEARAIYRTTTADWGVSAAQAPITAAVALEQSEAQFRGASFRPDQLNYAPASVLTWLSANKQIDPTLVAQVQAHIANSAGAA